MSPERTAVRSSFDAMGCRATVVVVGGGPTTAGLAERRIAELEGRWSRFRSDSEISRWNRADGRPNRVSTDTALLVARAVDGVAITGGAFDPTILPTLLALGYDRTFHSIPPDDGRPTPPPTPARGSGAFVADVSTGMIAAAPGVRFDPGGIGKGLAADLVLADLLDAGAAGACVDLGGDVRVAGQPPTEDGWQVAIEDPLAEGQELARVAPTCGAVVTSTTVHRAWRRGGSAVHHVIDPRRGRPTDSGIVAVTVLAASGWVGEVLATSVLVDGLAANVARLEQHRTAALVIDRCGAVACAGDPDRLREITWRSR